MQFGLVQDIPRRPENLDKLHNLDMRGNADENWIVRHGRFIQSWDGRGDAVITGQSLQGKPINTQEYMMWLTTNSRLYLSINQNLLDPRGSGAVNDREEAPTRQATQSRHRSRSRHATPTPSTFEDSEEHMPHRHSVSFPPTYQHYEAANQSVEYTPVQDHHRYSTASYDQDFLGPLLSPDYNTPPPYRYYQSILQSGPTWNPYQAGPSSSTGYQHEPPAAPAPDPTEEEIPARRPHRNRRPPRCGTGHHLGE